MKRLFLIFVLLGIVVVVSSTGPNEKVFVVKKVVIDAGHGGKDPGAVGIKNKEKDIALAIALKLGVYIKDNFPEVEVIYTRKTDVFVELYNRAKIANENHADLFISIHCNATTKPEVHGTETWVMGLHKSQANLEVAKLENSAILMESDYSAQYDGFDPNSPEANIIFSLFQNVFLDQSVTLAANVQDQFEKRAGRVNRGVKQAGFLVLYKTTMPGILIETGFISNSEEEAYMASEAGQTYLASAIYRAFRDYKKSLEGMSTVEDTEVTAIDTPIYIQEVKDTMHQSVPDTTANVKSDTKDVRFRVQFATSEIKKPLNSPDFKGLQDVRVYFHGGLYKYTSGNEQSLESAVKLQTEVQKQGFKDAFVVAFVNEDRVTPQEAVRILAQ